MNWFRKDADGKFLWPGYGENSRVLGLGLRPLRRRGPGRSTRRSAGCRRRTSLPIDGLELAPGALDELLSVDENDWRAELPLDRRALRNVRRSPADRRCTTSSMPSRSGAPSADHSPRFGITPGGYWNGTNAANHPVVLPRAERERIRRRDRRRRLLWTVVVMLALAAAVIAAWPGNPAYRASGTVIVGPPGTSVPRPASSFDADGIAAPETLTRIVSTLQSKQPVVAITVRATARSGERAFRALGRAPPTSSARWPPPAREPTPSRSPRR